MIDIAENYESFEGAKKIIDKKSWYHYIPRIEKSKTAKWTMTAHPKKEKLNLNAIFHMILFLRDNRINGPAFSISSGDSDVKIIKEET